MQSNNTSCNHWKTGRGSNGNLGAQTKMLLQFWNAWTLVFREKNQRQREYKNDSVSCGIDLSRAILAGRPSKRTGSFLRKKKKVGGKSPGYQIQPHHLESVNNNPISPPLWACRKRRVLARSSAGFWDFLFVENSTDKLYNDKWWPQHRGSTPSRDLRLSCNKFCLNPKTSRTTWQWPGFVCFHAKMVSEVWRDMKRTVLAFIHFLLGGEQFSEQLHSVWPRNGPFIRPFFNQVICKKK